MTWQQAELEELMRDYRRKLAKLTGLEERADKITRTAVSPGRSVLVTVDARGEICAIEFPTAAYRRIPAAELSAEILAAVGEARAAIREAVKSLIIPELPGGALASLGAEPERTRPECLEEE